MPDKIAKENFKVLRAFTDETEEFYSDVADEAETNLKNSDIKKYPAKLVKDYRTDFAKANAFYNKFCDLNDKIDPEDPDRKKVTQLEKLWASLAAQCEVLAAQNAMFTAYLDAKLATQYTGVVELMTLIVKNGEGELDRTIAKVERLTKDLAKAKKLVRQAEIQRGLNVAISVATTVLLPELKGAQVIYATLLVASSRSAIDDALGPTGATDAGLKKNVATEYAGMASTLGKAVNTSATIISGIDTLLSDGVEVKTAEKLLLKAKKELAAAEKTLRKLEQYAKPNGTTLLKMTVALEKAQSTTASKIAAFRAAKQKKAELQKEMEFQD
ncbi:hypothetical protein ACFO5X_05570 [Seohaeicola nanhaiensis]|uniref:Uncharacterized protein n=1 Tax=Seohaeicola nanhaiensis TaxID=1387282 RepID=A0ABV9KED5_9RHOB